MKIVIDIETVQTSKEEWATMQGISLSQGMNELNSNAEEDQIEKDYQKSVFDATFSRIICIGVLIFKDDMSLVEAIAWYGSNEKEILQRFWQRISQEPLSLIITHNGLGFDLPFIKKRSIIHQVKPTVDINLAKFRTDHVYDTMAVWANWEFRGFTKLDILARVLGVETKSGQASLVSEMWAKGKGEEIAEYCLQDTYVNYACYCRMTYREPKKSAEILKKKILHQTN